jgi:uncharacterized protein (TIGR03435 family)
MRRLLFLLAPVSCLFAQTFEVASIKPSGPLDPMAIQSGRMRIGMKVDGARVDIGAFSLKNLIMTAYEVKDYQVTGPEWLNAGPMTVERFNIQATLPEGATEKQVPQMLQALLADRFKLVVHKETRDHAVYALIVGKNGLKLKESEPDPPAPETPAEPKKGETVIGDGANQVRISGDPQKGMTVNSAATGQMRMTMVDGRMHMDAPKMSMGSLAEFATRFVDKPVVDMTELKGNYQVSFDLAMSELQNIARNMGVQTGESRRPNENASDPGGASIFMSIEKMGLKLEARKAPMPMIVVDHVEKSPTAN